MGGNRRLVDALQAQAFSALSVSPGARAYYRQLRARGTGHHAALRQLSNGLVGIVHGCLKTRTLYDEATAWSHHRRDQRAACPCLSRADEPGTARVRRISAADRAVIAAVVSSTME